MIDPIGSYPVNWVHAGPTMSYPVDWCFIHDRNESSLPTLLGAAQALQCRECSHTFLTRQALIDAWNDLAQMQTLLNAGPHPFDELLPDEYVTQRKLSQPNLATQASDVPFCPHCLHDF